MNELYKEMEELLGLLYQENEQQSYTKLIEVLPRLEKQIQELTSESKQQHAAEGLTMAMQAMEYGDYTLLADYLKYEVLEHLMEA